MSKASWGMKLLATVGAVTLTKKACDIYTIVSDARTPSPLEANQRRWQEAELKRKQALTEQEKGGRPA